MEQAFLGDVLGGAGQAGEVDEERSRGGGRGCGGEVQVQVHGSLSCGRLMAELEETASKSGDGRVGFESHCDDVICFSTGVCYSQYAYDGGEDFVRV